MTRAAGFAVGLLVVGLGGALLLRRPEPPPPRPAAAPPAARRPLPPSAAPTAPPARRPDRPEKVAPTLPPATLPPAPLRIEADVADASVFLDRRFLGKAPVEVRDVAPGSHRVNVSAEGYEMHAEDVVLGDAPVTVSVRFKEVRLDERLEVVHKHGFGSCRGRLAATPTGLSYEAADGKHSWRAPRAEVRIELDYLKKNLRVAASGRTYNFTVGGDSADPLLLFEKATAKAWARLP